MKTYIRKYLWLVTITFFVCSINAQQIWRTNSDGSFVLNAEKLNESLRKLDQDTSSITIMFPSLEGNLEPFKVYDNAVLPKSLAQKYPQVHSYKGVLKENGTVQLRFTCTPTGIEATLLSANNQIKNLTSPTADDRYILKNETDTKKVIESFKCNAEKHEKPQKSISPNTAKSKKSIPGVTQLKTIRLAVTTSGEYSDFFINKSNLGSGSDAQKRAAILAGVSTSINNINVAFERDLGVKFELIPNTDELFFLNRDTDPFTDPLNPFLSMDQGVTAIENTLPDSDYDLGHTLVGVGSAGLAELGIPCTDTKAAGVTGFVSPEGLFFDFTLFAHELGHQLGGFHTQSADCEIETPIEVGSGTTIMGYSGACENNNIQLLSDPFFHSLSIEQILPIVENLGLSNKCGVEATLVNNSLPEIPEIPNYTVPLGAQLYLEAVATDADDDILTYSWEPFELNTGFMDFPSPPVSDSRLGPQFRIFPPTVNPRRNFPRSGQNSKWEVLPTIPRVMNFKLFVRDGNPGGIRISDIVQINIVNQSTQFGITNPFLDVVYNQGEIVTITWDVAGTGVEPFNVENVKIDFSLDNGVTYPIVLSEEETNDGEATFVMPVGATTKQGKIRISALKNAFYTTTNNAIELRNLSVEENVRMSPNPSEGKVTFFSGVFPEGGYDLKIYSLSGQLLRDYSIVEEEQSFDFSSLTQGLYFVRISSETDTGTKKLVLK